MTTGFRFTTKDLEAMPDIEGVRYEIIDGELYVSGVPHAFHEFAADKLRMALRASSALNAAGVSYMAAGVVLAGNQSVIPDLIWISTKRLADGLDAAGHLTIAPELVVEVVTPGWFSEFRDRAIKLDYYSKVAVREYWIVDWRVRMVEVYRQTERKLLRVATLTNGDTLTSPMLPGFACPISNLWAPAVG